MCGLAGIYSWKASVTTEKIRRGTDALVHRGPDGEGIWISPRANMGLGHRRLSIVDLSTGGQPISSEDVRKHVIVNGEFYDHIRIRADLEKRGHVFRTRSDSEIVLHLYEEYGFNCLEHLRGEFAFILWDEDKQQMFAARDRFGIKPLVYAVTGDAVLLASEAKALFAMGLRPAWDEEAFFYTSAMQYTPQGRTLFKGVLQLKPGYALVARGGQVETFKYWDMDFPAESDVETVTDEPGIIGEFAHELNEAIRLRLMADVPICFHLSGGLDSASVLGMATAQTGRRLDAFTVSFDHEGYDELSIAQEMADHSGANLHAVHVSQEDLFTNLPDAVYCGEGLAINGHLAGKYLLNRAIRAAGFKVALTGEGSDEILAGYPHLRQDLFRHMSANDAATAEMTAQLYATNGVSAGVQLAHGDMLPTSAVRAQLGYVPSFIEAKAALGYRVSGVLSDGFRTRFAATDAFAGLMSAVPSGQLAGRHPVNQSSWLWSKLALANYILRTLGDGMEMAQSVEGRLPYLDHKLFEFARRLPMSFKIRGTVEKYILREAAKPFITQTIYKRQKHPFMAPPVSRFADGRLMTMIRDTLGSKSFADVPFFDAARASGLVARLPQMTAQDRTAAEPVLMTMLTAHMIQERFGLSA
ncbi:MAG: asparagine synthase (glutamine-hydrolyzing) [Alphaproteobacteria bacterium]|nr:MAG: asparagine synthase (glutamine-hydrolyzing) [Alphaproteobacteria bacterium]